jgi:uncharacterized NAD-dependent epimerase/dehydratase family protein
VGGEISVVGGLFQATHFSGTQTNPVKIPSWLQTINLHALFSSQKLILVVLNAENTSAKYAILLEKQSNRRLLSRTKLVMTDQRKCMDPSTLDMVTWHAYYYLFL